MLDNLIFDMNNMCNVHYYGNKSAEDEDYIGLCFQSMLQDMKKLHNEFKPKKVVMAFDNNSWRKLYTKDLSKCVTHLKYKGTRDNNKTQKEIERRNKLIQELNVFKEMLQKHTGVITLSAKWLEADDVIGGYTQFLPDESHIIVSSDKDFIQLIDENVRLYNPVADEFRTLNDWMDDAKFYLFEKCFRGDKQSDNIMSSYPRLSRKKIESAYTDEFIKNNIMNHEFVVEDIDQDGNLRKYTYKTKDVFDENEYLISLDAQPEFIRTLIKETIDKEIGKNVKFSLFHFLKFCGKYDLPFIIRNVDKFVPLLK